MQTLGSFTDEASFMKTFKDKSIYDINDMMDINNTEDQKKLDEYIEKLKQACNENPLYCFLREVTIKDKQYYMVVGLSTQLQKYVKSGNIKKLNAREAFYRFSGQDVPKGVFRNIQKGIQGVFEKLSDMNKVPDQERNLDILSGGKRMKRVRK